MRPLSGLGAKIADTAVWGAAWVASGAEVALYGGSKARELAAKVLRLTSHQTGFEDATKTATKVR